SSFCAIYRYKFGPRGDKPGMKLTWYDGGLRPEIPEELTEGEKLEGGGNGLIFIGEKGVISCAGWGGAPRIFPTSKANSSTPPAPTIARSKGHHRDWLDACKGGKPASSEFGYG